MQLRVVGVPAQLIGDQLLLLLIDAPVCLGRRDQGTQYGVAVGFGGGAVKLVHRLEGLLRCVGLLALPGLIGLECGHAQGGQCRVVHPAGAPLGRTSARRTAQHAAKATQ
ncbi:hypothetical protein AO066_14515 [Pseudomonas fluorescens]|nr:hypothetical protein AO066_14515 [Pseudomonas fluorescens]